ncbi:TlpA family protein disulfide reductase [Aquihabitans sp. G128]|uniref:TlpA family protein disulfide reductase n=1 Tax=Aquihabitans sp. G128 TaxID=2849779 RepID=UPI001C228251|nr:TlpA disulfide reductase family protein [Aquihabitans sp. G128]QXC63321.1 TlpA family protein disulfide reductase [Aquihabitans sp. G128]
MTGPVKPKERGPIVWYAVLALVVIAGVVAVVATRGSDDAKPVAGQTAAVTVAKDGADALPTFESAQDDPAVGTTIPTVSGTTLSGGKLTIGPDDGKAKVIIFAAHWCPHCQREIPLLAEHLKDSPMPDDVELLTVSTGVEASRGNYPPSAWLEDVGWTAPTLADSSKSLAASTFGLSSYPYFVVVDAEGKVVFRITGEISVDQFDQLVAAAQSGKSPI